MDEFVQLWVYLSSTPLFGLTATLVTYVAALAVYERVGRAPWANPVLRSVVVIGAVLVVTGTAYPVYFAGAQFIHVLTGRPWWRWLGRSGNGASRCGGVAGHCCWRRWPVAASRRRAPSPAPGCSACRST